MTEIKTISKEEKSKFAKIFVKDLMKKMQTNFIVSIINIFLSFIVVIIGIILNSIFFYIAGCVLMIAYIMDSIIFIIKTRKIIKRWSRK